MDQTDKILHAVLEEKRNVYITGEAGTGKSYLLSTIAHELMMKDLPYAVLAPTGLAAINVRGQTIHKFCGLPPKPGYQLIEDLGSLNRPRKKKLLNKLHTIIIDEVSMVRADMFDALDMFFKLNRENPSEPFGGLQVLLFGDHFQLPPIVKQFEKQYFQGGFYKSPFFFDSKCYEDLGLLNVKLLKNYRQNDQKFIKMLRLVREGNLQPTELDYLNEEFQVTPHFDEEYTITIAGRNDQVAAKNQQYLSAIDDKEFVFRAKISGNFDTKQTPAESELSLKVGAQVMFLKNDPENKWVNGTIGKINSITNSKIFVELTNKKIVEVEPETWSKIEYTLNVEKGVIEEQETGSMIQYPLKLAWAVTIHKSQGQTYDNCFVDLGWGAFAPGQTYVALSRSRTLEGLHLKRKLYMKDIIIDPNITTFDANTEWNAEI